MKTQCMDGFVLFYDEADKESVAVIGETAVASAEFIQSYWGLDRPEKCRIYVMLSWLKFIFHSAPWAYRIYYALFLPFIGKTMKAQWPFVGGYALRFRKRPAIGVKPPRLFKESDTSIGEKIFVQIKDTETKMRHIVCHEIMHVFTGHLKLPDCLNEGIAILATDKFSGSQVVKPETIDLFWTYAGRELLDKPGYSSEGRKETVVYNYIKGYWIIRYIEDKHPELLRSLISRRKNRKKPDRLIADALGIRHKNLWNEIDQIVLHHFTGKVLAANKSYRRFSALVRYVDIAADKYSRGNKSLNTLIRILSYPFVAVAWVVLFAFGFIQIFLALGLLSAYPFLALGIMLATLLIITYPFSKVSKIPKDFLMKNRKSFEEDIFYGGVSLAVFFRVIAWLAR